MLIMNTNLVSRKDLSMTLREFSAALGVSYETVRLWEKGRMKPTADRLIVIYTDCEDWRRIWARQQLEQFYPKAWALLCVQA